MNITRRTAARYVGQDVTVTLRDGSQVTGTLLTYGPQVIRLDVEGKRFETHLTVVARVTLAS